MGVHKGIFRRTDQREALKVRARGLVQSHGRLEFAEFGDGCSQMHDGIVGPWNGSVAGSTFDHQTRTAGNLLRRGYSETDDLSVIVRERFSTLKDGVFAVDLAPLLIDQVSHSNITAAFL